MNPSIEGQLATAWDMATREIAGQAERIKELEASLSEEAGPRARMAFAKQAAEIQIGMNALGEVGEMLKADVPDLDGIRERLDRVNALLSGLHEQATAEGKQAPPEQADQLVTLASRAGRKR
jgi:hypothetical protein